MAELADAADLKSAGLKRLVGVRVPLSAPITQHTLNAFGTLAEWLLIRTSRIKLLIAKCMLLRPFLLGLAQSLLWSRLQSRYRK